MVLSDTVVSLSNADPLLKRGTGESPMVGVVPPPEVVVNEVSASIRVHRANWSALKPQWVAVRHFNDIELRVNGPWVRG